MKNSENSHPPLDSIEEIRKTLKDPTLSDEEVRQIDEDLAMLARLLVKRWMESQKANTTEGRQSSPGQQNA